MEDKKGSNEVSPRVSGQEQTCKVLLKVEHPTTIFSENEKSQEREDASYVSIASYPREGTEPAVTNPVSVLNIDFHLSVNGTRHKTANYFAMKKDKTPSLVVRRGRDFKISLILSRGLDIKRDRISFTFSDSNCSTPKCGSGTLVEVPLLYSFSVPEPTRGYWSAVCNLINPKANILSIKITPAVDCIIGKWKMVINSGLASHSSSEKLVSFTYPGLIYILFNAWSKEDDAYMDNEKERQEFILSEIGAIYRGIDKVFSSHIWNFSQYESQILDAAIHIVTNCSRQANYMLSSPTQVALAVISAFERRVIIEETTNDNFKGGVDPFTWDSSKLILQNFLASGKAIKYGNCWVVAAVTTSIFRALGLGARPVTGFAVLYTEDGNRTHDYYYNFSRNDWSDMNSYSIWNFYVWCEMFCARRDIGPEYDGWQLVDRTKGPAPVSAVKRGRSPKPYNTTAFVGFLNACVLYWKCNTPAEPKKLVSRSCDRVGKLIVTKSVGKFAHMEITSDYKIVDSAEKLQKGSLYTTMKSTFSSIGTHYLNEEFDKLEIVLKLEDSVMIGSDSLISVQLENTSDEDLTLNISILAHSVFYNGSKYRFIKSQKNTMCIQGKQSAVEEMLVLHADYTKKLFGHHVIHIECLVEIPEKNWDFFAEDVQRIVSPELVVKLIGERELYKKIMIEASFTNLMKVPLRAVQFCLEESSSSYGAVVNMNEIKALSVGTAKFFIIPYKVGKYLLTTKLKTSEFQTEAITEFNVFN